MTPEETTAIRERRLRQLRRSDDDHPFKDADARRVDLSGMKWDGEDFSGCNLRGADLSRCTFADANFREADLWNANLSDSDLTAACGLLPAQLAATDLTRAKLPESLSSFEALDSVKNLSENSSKVFITIILAVVYTFLTIETTRDVQVITDATSSKLPVIGTEIPIRGFYFATPLILLALYIYFHIYLQRMWEAFAKLPAIFPNGRRLDEKTQPWLMNDFARQHFPRLLKPALPLSILQAVLSILLGYVLVPVALFALWLRFLRFQDSLSGFHVVLIAIAVGSGAYFARMILETLCREGQGTYRIARFGHWLAYWLGIWRGVPAGFVALFATLAWSLLVVFVLADKGCSHTAPVVDDEDISTRPASWTGLGATRDTELRHTKGAVLQNKRLRGIRAQRVFLVNALLRDVDLSYANFSKASCIGTRFLHCDLQSAIFTYADCSHANFSFCDLRDADFSNAWLEDADFSADSDVLTADQLLKAKTLYHASLPPSLKSKLEKEIGTTPPSKLEWDLLKQGFFLEE